MDPGQIVFVYSRLILGAIAAFLAIMLWSKTRDTAWLLIVIGAIIAYIEIVYSVLEIMGITGGRELLAGSGPIAAIVLTSLRMIFFIAAFLIMIARRKKI